MSAASKLSDERVRAILCVAVDARDRMGRENGIGTADGAPLRVTLDEVEALAQCVLDLRTANGILNVRIGELEAECVGREVIAAST